jgi:hypothetical protein
MMMKVQAMLMNKSAKIKIFRSLLILFIHKCVKWQGCCNMTLALLALVYLL